VGRPLATSRTGLNVGELAARMSGEAPAGAQPPVGPAAAPTRSGLPAGAPIPAAAPPAAADAPSGSPIVRKRGAVGAGALAIVRHELRDAVARGDAERAQALSDELKRLKGL
jgi:hypothetical protein